MFVEKNSIIYSTFGDVYYVDGIFTASDEVSIFKHERLNKYTGLFVATIMKQNKYKYSFGRKAFKNKFTKDRIQLPVDLQDKPPNGGSLMLSIVAASVDKWYHKNLTKIS